MSRLTRSSLVVAGLLACVLTIRALASGISDGSGPGDSGSGGSGTPPAQPGSIAASTSAYYGPFKCFGARAVVFYVTTGDADSLSTATVELSDDGVKYYAVSAAVGANGVVTLRNLASKSINGRIGTATYEPVTDGSAVKAHGPFITDRYIKLKLTALGNQVDGVAVKPIIVYENTTSEEIEAAVYSWTLPS